MWEQLLSQRLLPPLTFGVGRTHTVTDSNTTLPRLGRNILEGNSQCCQYASQEAVMLAELKRAGNSLSGHRVDVFEKSSDTGIQCGFN